MGRSLRIGAFAQLCGVSIKTLRFYDDEALLKPRDTDPATGYRYYAPEQVTDANAILNLREAGLSVAQIRALTGSLSDTARLADALESQRSELLRRRSEIEASLTIVDALTEALNAGGETLINRMRLKAIAPQPAYTIRRRVGQLGAPVTEMFEMAEAAVARRKARADASPFLIFHDWGSDNSGIDLEACIPVTNDPPDDLPIAFTAARHIVCSLSYAGSYAQTRPLIEKLHSVLKAAGLKRVGPPREVYHRFGADQEDYRLPSRMIVRNERDYLTELQIPVSIARPHPGE